MMTTYENAMTIATRLDGTKVEELIPAHKYGYLTGIYEFEDGSQAIMITKLEAGNKPYLTPSLSTASYVKVRYWKAV